LQPKLHWLSASVGHPSRVQVNVPGRKNYIYAQLWDTTKRLVQAYCPWETPSYGQLVQVRLVQAKGGSYYEVGQPPRASAPTLTGKQVVYGQAEWTAPPWAVGAQGEWWPEEPPEEEE